ncbi:MAG: hypothetical protein VYA34_09170 [Myxococcota bacterium]|nr:hypothetical protein [Myxococcota bacterium]
MEEMAFAQLVGAWVSIFLTLTVLSFLFDDNPIYKVAEHLFMGVATGYGIVEAYWNLLKPNLFDKIGQGFSGESDQLIYLIPLVLSVMLLFKISPKYAWVARVPIAILVAAYAAVKITGETSGKLIGQIGASFPNMSESWDKHGLWNWEADGAGVISDTLLVVGLSACLIHFYFSEIDARSQRLGVPMGIVTFVLVMACALTMAPIESTGGKIAVGLGLGLCAAAPFLTLSPYKHLLTRFGVMVLMISFGASFGFTVMGRISLAIGRGQELLGQSRAPVEVAQIHPQIATLVSAVIIITCLFIFRKKEH